jgi:hypothetical protein
VTSAVYLDMLEQYLMPILQEEGPNDVLFYNMECLCICEGLPRIAIS